MGMDDRHDQSYLGHATAGKKHTQNSAVQSYGKEKKSFTVLEQRLQKLAGY